MSFGATLSSSPRASRAADVVSARVASPPRFGPPPSPSPSFPIERFATTDSGIARSSAGDRASSSPDSAAGRSMRLPSAEVTAWKADRRLAAWLAERRKKDAARRLGTIRRAHRDLDWVIERRKAQIAATRRDAKNDKERKAAFEAASRERRAELAVAIPADPPRRPGPAPARPPPPPRPKRRLGKAGADSPEAADPVTAQPAAASSSSAPQRPSRDADATRTTAVAHCSRRSSRRFERRTPKLEVASVWVAPGRFQCVVVEKQPPALSRPPRRSSDAGNRAQTAADERGGAKNRAGRNDAERGRRATRRATMATRAKT